MMKKITMIFTIIGISMILFYSVNKATGKDEELQSLKNPIVTVLLENSKDFEIELYPEYAPNTVNNFIDLVNKKFYDDMPFSKIIPNYLLQTGDPIGDGTGFPGYFIKSECKQNGFKNKLKCEQGTVCMARSKKYDTEGSQFFILLQENFGLNGQYAAFGKVIKGMDVLQEIGKAPVDGENIPLQEIKIKTITVNTFGVKYEEPQVISIYEHRDK
ncbi:MAG: peptidyl-prolyl cis-trans isomerase cyclophilin type [Clostridia bacterium]|jgi:peptidyl-prolyl cis-trans isomerase B (cyclophilin B)|nr:peptidyl-prolyl cis-trans isomerase cyclophilin type [Clostridia bacterium]